jgi:DNA segregation ATPase FtsK/SpoIIIE-like protein
MARKKHVTYDSRETATVVGLISLLIGVFFLITLFSLTDNQNNLFTQARGIFGFSTVVTVIFLFSLGLHFLGSRLPFASARSVAAQGVLVVLFPALLTAFATSERELNRGETGLGGMVGGFIVRDIFGSSFPVEFGTRIVLFLAVAILIPMAISMSISNIIDKIAMFLGWLKKVYTFVFNRSENSQVEDVKQVPEKAARLGDFNELIKQKKNLPVKRDDDDEDEIKPLPVKRVQHEGTEVEVKEGELGEDGLKQDDLKYPNWKLPPLSLLIPWKKAKAYEPAIEQNARIIEQILESFGIEAKVEESYIGPSIIQYALNIPLGIKVAKVATLSENIALALGVDSKAVRIESIPETTYLGIEMPRSKRDMVRFKEIMESDEMETTNMALPVPIGKNIDGSSVIGDIQKMPHLLIAGATGSGKSVLTNSFISSILMKKTPDEVKFILVDPKQVELSDYNGIPHLLTPVITDMKQVVNALQWAVKEMEIRYTNLAREQVRNIQGFNEKKGFAAMPYIVIVIDEMADMMMTANKVDAETAIVRLAQKARAVGIHLILATQRPSVNVITGIIKANIPGRIGMSVTSSTDSRVILDRIGAESLLGYGDLLYKAPDKPKSSRLQSSFIDQQEVVRVVDFLKSQAPEVEYVNEIVANQNPEKEEGADEGDFGNGGDLLEQAIRIAVTSQKGSSSFLQRRLRIGFNKAASLLEELEELGVVGPANGSKPREVLIQDAEAFIQSLKGE